MHLLSLQSNSTKSLTTKYGIIKHINSSSLVAPTSDLNKKLKDSGKNVGQIAMIFVIPSLMHLSAYIMGFIYFRIRENEQLYALVCIERFQSQFLSTSLGQ